MAGTDYWRTFVSALSALPTEVYPQAKDLFRALTRLAQVQYGTYTGTGVAITQATDGDPKLVILVNVTQQTVGLQIDGMADASYFKIDNAATAYVAADGMTLGTGQFIIGTDANINSNLDSGFWIAII